jgi:hypothetical protein
MVEWLESTVPGWLMGLILIGGGALVTWIAVHFRHGFARHGTVAAREPGEPEADEPGKPEADSALNDLTAVFVLIVAAMYGILVAFTIFIVWNNLDRADSTASAEAGAITALARQSIAFPQPGQRDLQQALRAYTESVIRDEWPAMAHGQSSPVTTQLFNHIFVVAFRLPATTSSDISSELANLSEQRTALLLASGAALPTAFWVVLIIGAVLSIALSVFFFTETPRAHGLMAVAAAVLICGSLWLILEVDRPFSGISVQPDAFERALTNITAIQSGQL